MPLKCIFTLIFRRLVIKGLSENFSVQKKVTQLAINLLGICGIMAEENSNFKKTEEHRSNLNVKDS